MKSIVGMLLGAAAGLATGRGDVGQAVMMGGAQLGQRTLLSFSRTQEGQADQAALRFLTATKQSARGLLEFFNILGAQDLVSARYQDPYTLTHPLTRDRMDTVQNYVQNSPYSNNPTSPEFTEMHKRMRAKLVGFLESFQTAIRRYPETDTSPEARYARSIAYYRKADLATALPLIDQLIAEAPGDPYYLELKGQMLFENGRVAEAVAPYQAAVLQLPSSGLLRLGLARAQIEAGQPELLDPAIDNLRGALRSESGSAFTWRQLAIAYGRKGDEAEGSVALAEEALLLGKPQEALYHAGRAENLVPRGSAAWLKAQDIVNAAQQLKEQRKERDRN
jgi:predicted Zn-dependent protease